MFQLLTFLLQKTDIRKSTRLPFGQVLASLRSLVIKRPVNQNSIRMLLTIALLPWLCCGCFYMVVGSIGALGGYVVSPDTVEGTTERDFEEAWDSTVKVMGIMGQVLDQSEREGAIEAIINNARVNVKIYRVSKDSVRVSVKARKSFFPSIATAQDVYVKILNEISGS